LRRFILGIIIYIVLGIISYHIGGGLKLRAIKDLGKAIAWITLLQALFPWMLTILLITFAFPLMGKVSDAAVYNSVFPMALILGAIACCSAPAAIVGIIHEGKANGPVTTITLAVLALTDALAAIAYAVSAGVAQPLANGDKSIALSQMLLVPLLHLVESIIIGILIGSALLYVSRRVSAKPLLLVIVLGFIAFCVGLTEHLGISSIIAGIVMGFTVTNTVNRDDMFLVVEEIGDVLFTAFFVLNGMFFDLGGMKSAGILTLLIIIGRKCGKYSGARLGARIAGAPEAIEKYSGLMLLPKAGLTLGLAFLAKDAFPSFGSLMFDAIVASTIINMLITPPLAKYALYKVKEWHYSDHP